MDDFETRLQAERDAWCEAHDTPGPGAPMTPAPSPPQTFHDRSLARALAAKELARSRQRVPDKRRGKRQPSLYDAVRKPSIYDAVRKTSGLSPLEREQF